MNFSRPFSTVLSKELADVFEREVLPQISSVDRAMLGEAVVQVDPRLTPG